MSMKLIYRKLLMLLLMTVASWSVGAMAQNVTLSGTVTDDVGQPLVGCSVLAGNKGTATDLNGKFTITAPAGTKVRFEYVGYERSEYTLSSDMSGTVFRLHEMKGGSTSSSSYSSGRYSDSRRYFGTNQLFYEVEAGTDNLTVNAVTTALMSWANNALAENEHPALFYNSFIYQPAMHENHEPVASFKDQFSFKPKDLFRLVRAGGKLGWKGGLNSCFGVFGRFYYEYRRNYTKLIHSDDYEYYWTSSIQPGIGVHFAPQFGTRLQPYLELGTTYNKVLSCKSPYGKDKDQFGSGLIYSFAIGIGSANERITLGVELPKYNYFNRDWTPDGGFYYPYANIKERRWRITLNFKITSDSFSRYFGDD